MDPAAQSTRWSDQLSQGLATLQLELVPHQQRLLIDYLALLMKWNRAYNLTAVRDFELAVSRQLLDSLAVLPLLAGDRILDLGSGPGLPGIPLAIARPDLEFTLLDANGKKCRFMDQARLELTLRNVSVVSTRVEDYRMESGFDLILSRAFASLVEMVSMGSHLLSATGGMLALKGKLPQAEIVALKKRGLRVDVYPLRVPGTEGERHAIRLRPQRDSGVKSIAE